MYIGICKIKIRLPENNNLKGKRKIVKSLRDRIESRFKVTIAEVGDNDLWQIATLGLACVSNDSKIIQQILSKIRDYIQLSAGDFELLDWQQKIVTEK